MPATAEKDDRVQFRVSSEDKKRLEKAAEARGVSLSSFITQTMLEEADRVISERNTTVLSERDWEAFMSALEKDSPNEDLQEAIDEYNEMAAD